MNEWEREVRKVVRPEPGTFQPPGVTSRNNFFDESGNLKEEHRVDLIRDYAKRGLQVIVKLANIHLTPEKPEYAGGTWHVEGQLVRSQHVSLNFEGAYSHSPRRMNISAQRRCITTTSKILPSPASLSGSNAAATT